MIIDDVRLLLGDVLGLPDGGAGLRVDSALLGSLPELDSMAVISLIGALEEQFGIEVDDDEITAATFETLGSLTAMIERKTRQQLQ